ncbi:MAG TPA: hypothetical protein DEQ38_10420 [Elusimicrobia bacterium]|nr:MAG: hypothetical protein A2089_11820 [Elusimicrobia bacterium GWD2_63_28]HCC48510.1 hypothetical protein [Elusimicrobiota bacterium]
MIRKTPIYELKIFNAMAVAFFAIFLSCLADLSYGQTALSQLAGYEAAAGPEAPAPERAAFSGRLSFSQAADLILSADKSVYLTALALPGDEDGRRMGALLLAKKRDGLDVRLSVDGAEAEAFRPLLKELSAKGIQVRVFRLSYCSSLVPYARLLLTDGKYTDLDGAADSGSAFILPNQQASGLDDAIVFFFTANDDGSKPKSSKIMSSCQVAAQGSALDDSIVFFFTANDGGTKPN